MFNHLLTLLFQAMRTGQNPVMLLQQQAADNPQVQQAVGMIQGKSPQQLEQIARNMAREKGIDIDAELKRL